MSGVTFPTRESEEVEDENEDLDPELVMPHTEKDRYQRGRDGDAWVCPFQCELCHFRNVFLRDPVPTARTDCNFVIYCRRASLDAMWARSSATVAKTMRVLSRNQVVATNLFGLANPFPFRHPFPLQDDFGIVPAILFLEESRRPGRNTAPVQWDTARGLTSAMTNLYSSGRDSLGAQVASKDSRKLRITLCPTKSEFFERFHAGSRYRRGINRRQDYALMPHILLGLLAIMEETWQASEEAAEKEAIEDVAIFAILTYVAGLRGEEVPLLDFHGLCQFWEETKGADTPHVILTLRGRFKGEEGWKWHMLPIADVTKSGIPHRRWIGRGMASRKRKGWNGGWFFSRRGRIQARMADYDPAFKQWLVALKQERPGLIPDRVDPMEDMSLRRSGRRAATTEVQNNGLGKPKLELHNRWKKVERARGAAPQMDMVSTYTQTQEALKARLEFSQHV